MNSCTCLIVRSGDGSVAVVPIWSEIVAGADIHSKKKGVGLVD